MAYFALIYHVVDDYLAKRIPLRPAHLKLAAEAFAQGELVMGGAFSDPVDAALLIFRGEDKSVAEKFVARDPYVLNGLVQRWELRPWTVVIGGDATAAAGSPNA